MSDLGSMRSLCCNMLTATRIKRYIIYTRPLLSHQRNIGPQATKKGIYVS